MPLRTVPLLEAHGDAGDVFVDNVMLSSADRVLGGHYDALQDEPALELHGIGPSLFVHDVLNLAALMEALICHERLYVNAAYLDRWSSGSGTALADELGGLVVGITWPKDFQREAESSIVNNREWPRYGLPGTIGALADSVCLATHHGFERTYYADVQAKISVDEISSLYVPYAERTRPFGRGMDLTVGTGFYTTCSQILGIPYRPSLIRAEVLRGYLSEQLASIRFDAGRVAFDLLERTFDEAATEAFSRLVEMNMVDLHPPAVLSAVMSKVESASDLLPRALDLRDTAGAQAFRRWNTELTQSIQGGDIKDAARRMGELRDIVRKVNRSNGLEPPDIASMSLGWGPVSFGKTFDLPQRLRLPISFRRHAWFLQNLYGSLLITGRWGEKLNELLLPRLPTWFRQCLSESEFDWSEIGRSFRAGQIMVDSTPP